MDDQNKSVNERWAPPPEPDARGYAGEDPADTTRRTAEIRADIERTRADMTETIDAIQERVRPANVVSRAADNVREATMEKVRSAASTVQRSMPDTSAVTNNAFIDRIRENPTAAIIAGASLAWLLFGGRKGERHTEFSETHHSPGYAGEYEAYDPRLGTLGHERHGSHESQDHPMSRAAEAAGDARARLRRATSGARSGARRVTRDQPLAAAGVAAVAGLAFGFLLPETERENELMGEARDKVVERARQRARETADKVQDVAQEVTRVAAKAIPGTETDSTTPRSDG